MSEEILAAKMEGDGPRRRSKLVPALTELPIESNERVVGAPIRSSPLRVKTTDSSQKNSSVVKPRIPQPKGTKEYVITADDTINSIAVRFDMTPSEIKQLNKINHVFPGKTIYVKDPDAFLEADEDALQFEPNDEVYHILSHALGPVSPTEKVGFSGKSAFFQEMEPKPEAAKPPPAETIEFINETFARIKVYLVTNGQGVIPGIMEVNEDFVTFRPLPGPLLREQGPECFTLSFDTTDLLPPRSQVEAPDFSRRRPVLPESGPHHKVESNSEEVKDRQIPQYVELRVRLIYGQKPTAGTVQPYWFAVSGQWIDPLFAFMWRHCQLEEIPSSPDWEFLEHPKDRTPTTTAAPWSSPSSTAMPEPELLSKPNILTPELLKEICGSLPVLKQMMNWEIIFSTYEHGMSLAQLYRNFSDYEDASVLLVATQSGAVFGAFCTHPWEVAEAFYGGGECFLFKKGKKFETFKWTGKNAYFMMGKGDSLVMGGGNGSFGLWVDESFLNGSSHPCPTFDNDSLSDTPDFRIIGVEAWGFVSQF